MPNTPQVKFNFTNNNVQSSVPLLGVSHVIARTTKGPFNDPSTLLNSYPQFQRIFGEEIVPDGTVSNIKKAFELGSKLRVSRVAGWEGAKYGWAGEDSTEVETQDDAVALKITLTEPVEASPQTLTFTMKIRTKEAGSPVVDDSGYNLNRPFYLNIGMSVAAKATWSISQYKDKDNLTSENLLATINMLSGSNPESSTAFIDVNVFKNFLNSLTNIELIFDKAEGTGNLVELATRIKDMNGVVNAMSTYSNWKASMVVGTTTITESESVLLTIHEGTDGGNPSAESVVAAYQATKDYQDGYQLILSHGWQWTFAKTEDGTLDNQGYNTATVQIAEDVIKNFETVLYIEVPKYAQDGENSNPMIVEQAVAYLKDTQGRLGYAKNIAYFGGGIKYYDDGGNLQNCDVLGSILGLGDTAASLYGPWYSFAGMNRGVLGDAQGPVMENLGSPSKVESLQTLAEWYCNIIVMKNTPTRGLRTMLWHCFSSNQRDDSEKFLSIVRLNLYLKKNLRPILESYLEEPNTFSTWQDIYQEAKDRVLDPLVGDAMTEYTWQGDQDASSYEDLKVNTEADVRQGKYHVVLTYQDIVPMQEVTIDIVIDAASRTISIDTEE